MYRALLILILTLIHPVTAYAQTGPVALRGVDISGEITSINLPNKHAQRLTTEVNFLLPVTLQDDPDVELSLEVTGQLSLKAPRLPELTIGESMVGVMLLDISRLDNQSRVRGQMLVGDTGADVLFGWRGGQQLGVLREVEVTIPNPDKSAAKQKAPLQYSTKAGVASGKYVVQLPTSFGGIENYVIRGIVIASGGGSGI